jgi:hypothetical protein
VKKSTEDSTSLLQHVFELQVASSRGNCTSVFKFGRTGTVFKLFWFNHVSKKIPAGALLLYDGPVSPSPQGVSLYIQDRERAVLSH